jgi:CHAT domain-containing protein/tetratricopeptide (TPR) repeat protein
VLEPGRRLRGELGPGEVDAYRLDLEAGSYLRLLIDQNPAGGGVDVEAALYSPGGEPLLTADGPAGRRIPEVLPRVATEAGAYRLEIRAADPGDAGDYGVWIDALRPAEATDDSRVAAEIAFTEAAHLQELQDPESRRRALALYRRALPLWQEVGDVDEEGQTLNRIGLVLAFLGEEEEAAAWYRRALERFGEVGLQHRQAETLINLGDLRQSRKPREALDFYLRALEIWRQLDQPGWTAAVLLRLGRIHCRLGDEVGALAAFDQALELARGPGARTRILNSLGVCQRQLGDAEGALASYRQALVLAREAGDEELEAAALSNLGVVHRRRGEFRQALDAYHQALEINRRHGQLKEVADVRRNLGTAHVGLGQLEEARVLFREALEGYQAREELLDAFQLQRSLAWVEVALGDTPRGLEILNQALANAARLPEAEIQRAEILQAIGYAYFAAGEPERGVAPLEEALGLVEGQNRPALAANLLGHLGSVRHRLGQLDRAAAELGRAIELARRIGYRTTEAAALAQLARVERDRGDLEGARKRFEDALRIVEEQRLGAPTPELRATFLAQRRRSYEAYVDLLLRLDHRHPGRGHGAQAFHASELAHARGLLDLLHERGQEIERGIDPALLEREREVAARLSYLQTVLAELSREEPGGAERESLERRLRRAEAERRELELRIRLEHPRYADLRYPEPLPLGEVRRLLDRDTALLEYTVGEEGTSLFAVTAEGAGSFRLGIADHEIADRVQELRRSIAAGGRRRLGSYRRAADELYRRLVAPAAEQLAGKSRLLIVPDRALHYLPFETLLTAPAAGAPLAELPYLLRRWSVAYAPSASVLGTLAPPSAPARAPEAASFVAFADPIYPGSTGADAPRAGVARGAGGDRSELPRLRASGAEVRRIADLYPETAVALFLRAEATEEKVKRSPLLASARRLHFAVHGQVDERSPALSRLVLGRDPASAEDGYLQVYEIFNLELAAELVVLSACDTGLGREITGEGLIGLTRAFLYAGAPRVVVSLWSVDDASTADLMVAFYRGLERDGGTVEALRRAKLELIDAGLPPGHWAPFVLVGRPL